LTYHLITPDLLPNWLEGKVNVFDKTTVGSGLRKAPDAKVKNDGL